MTREEVIEKASKEFACNKEYYFVFDVQDAFENGAKWADKNPNLSQVWHDASEEPKENSKIVIVDTKGEWWNIDYISDDFDGSGLYGWEFCVAHYNLKQWAYIADLLPKGGKL